MKVEGPGKSSNVKGPSKTGAKKNAGDASFSGMVSDTSETGSSSAASGVMNINRLDALLSLQEASDGTSEEAAKRAKQRATAMLDVLDQIQIGLLSGGIPQSTLKHLSQMVSAKRDPVMDPRLAAVLDEIDLRVQVELAKFS